MQFLIRLSSRNLTRFKFLKHSPRDTVLLHHRPQTIYNHSHILINLFNLKSVVQLVIIFLRVVNSSTIQMLNNFGKLINLILEAISTQHIDVAHALLSHEFGVSGPHLLVLAAHFHIQLQFHGHVFIKHLVSVKQIE